jgi:hypothetical protein
MNRDIESTALRIEDKLETLIEMFEGIAENIQAITDSVKEDQWNITNGKPE